MVFYCVFYDENESIKSQRRVEDRKTSEKVVNNALFLKFKFDNENQDAITKKKGKQRKTKAKGKTVPVIIAKKYIRFKQSSLRGKRSIRGKQHKKFGRLQKKTSVVMFFPSG